MSKSVVKLNAARVLLRPTSPGNPPPAAGLGAANSLQLPRLWQPLSGKLSLLPTTDPGGPRAISDLGQQWPQALFSWALISSGSG
jgi:hypothetical protein